MLIAIASEEELDIVWPHVTNHLHRAIKLSDGRHSEELVYRGIENRSMQLWVMINDGKCLAACVTEIRNYPRGKILAILLCGGREMNLWLNDFVAKLRDVSRRHGICSIETIGRPGWVRALKNLGFIRKRVEFLEAQV